MATGLVGAALANPTPQTIREANIERKLEGADSTSSWVGYTRAGTPDASIKFVSGPGTPPAGTGSLQLTTTTSSEKAYVFNFDQIGTRLADISEISYETYRSAGAAQQVTALNMVIDFNGSADGGFSTLVFEPVYNTSQGLVVSGEWQDWYAHGDGIWWSTRAINGQCAGATAACDQTWSEIVAKNPDATILGGFGVNQGSGNPGLTTAVDNLTLITTNKPVVYNFEDTDSIAPVLELPEDISVGATSAAGAQVAYAATAADAVDGVIAPACTPASGSTFKPGTTLVVCTATDAAGNNSTGTFNVTVSFTHGGFYQPVDMQGVVNQARRGSVVPVKFEVFGADGVEMTDTAVVNPISVQPSSACNLGASADAIEQYASSTAPLRYDTANGQFIFNWRTPSAPGCYSVVMTTTDGGSLSAIFRIR